MKGKKAKWLDTRDGCLPALVPPSDPLRPRPTAGVQNLRPRHARFRDPHRLPTVPCQKKNKKKLCQRSLSCPFGRPPSVFLPACCATATRRAADFGEGPLADGQSPGAKRHARSQHPLKGARSFATRAVCVCVRALAHASRWCWASYLWLWEITGWLERWVKQQTMKCDQRKQRRLFLIKIAAASWPTDRQMDGRTPPSVRPLIFWQLRDFVVCLPRCPPSPNCLWRAGEPPHVAQRVCADVYTGLIKGRSIWIQCRGELGGS